MSTDKYTKKLLSLIADEQGVDEILDYLEEVIKSPVYLLDQDFMLIHEEGVEKTLDILDEITIDIIGKRLKKKDSSPLIIEPGKGDKEIIRLYPIQKQDTTLAHLLVVKDKLVEGLERWLQEILQLMKIVVTQIELIKRNGVSNRTDFVTNALMGHTTDEEALRTLCAINGFDYTLKRQCVFIRMPRNIHDYDDYHQRELSIKKHIKSSGKAQGLNVYTLQYNNNLILFLLYKDGLDIKAIEMRSEEFVRVLEEAISSILPVKIGMGRCYEGINNLGESFRQGVKAINLGDRLFPESCIYSFTRNSIYHVLYDNISYVQLNELYEDTVLTLYEEDMINETELALTLRTYMECQYKAGDTAKKLHLHRNTLAYRLDKIRDILDYNFDDHQENMKLQMGIYSKEIIDIYDSI